jgi:hypothetical protein
MFDDEDEVFYTHCKDFVPHEQHEMQHFLICVGND